MKDAGKKDLGAVLVILGFCAVLFLLGITCPIKFLTGISCPGCGLTRACLSLLRLDPAAATRFHPLVWLLPAFPLLWLFQDRLPKRAVRAAAGALGAAFLSVYLFRMLSGCAPDVVAFSPKDGLVCRLAALLLSRAAG